VTPISAIFRRAAKPSAVKRAAPAADMSIMCHSFHSTHSSGIATDGKGSSPEWENVRQSRCLAIEAAIRLWPCTGRQAFPPYWPLQHRPPVLAAPAPPARTGRSSTARPAPARPGRLTGWIRLLGWIRDPRGYRIHPVSPIHPAISRDSASGGIRLSGFSLVTGQEAAVRDGGSQPTDGTGRGFRYAR
jgi:hypothetical protein